MAYPQVVLPRQRRQHGMLLPAEEAVVMTEIVAADIGGTHVRFALAEIFAWRRVTRLDDAATCDTADYAKFQRAWAAFGERLGRPLPRALAISFAGPVHAEVLKLTSTSGDCPGEFRQDARRPASGAGRTDFGAALTRGDVSRTVGSRGTLCGHWTSHCRNPVRSASCRVQGTGLGVADVFFGEAGRYHVVVETGRRSHRLRAAGRRRGLAVGVLFWLDGLPRARRGELGQHPHPPGAL